MVEAFEPRGRYVLVRNPAWWGASDYPHNIDRVVHTWKGDAENLAALLKGEIDLLLAPPYAALDQIRPRTEAGAQNRADHAVPWPYQGSPELRSSNVKGRNPFKDKRVRRAISYAIDIEAILGDLLDESLTPAGMLVAPGVDGYAPELDQPPPHDPERARALLTTPATRTASA